MSNWIRVVAGVARDANLRRIELAFLGFNMAEYATWIAILVYAYTRGGAAAAGIVVVVQLVPSGLAAPFAAFAGDRFRRDRVLVTGYVVQAAAIGATAVALSANAPQVAVYGFATLAAISFTFTRPVQSALLPGVTRTVEDLTAANAVSGLAESAGILVGPFTAGILLAASGPAAVFAVFTVVALVSALLVAGLRIDPAAVTPGQLVLAGDVVSGTLSGFRVLRVERHARLIVLVLSACQLVTGALDVLFVAVAIDLLHEGEGWAGFLNSAFGLGGIGGAALAIALVGRRRLSGPLGGGALVFGGPVALIAVTPTIATAPALFAVSGAGRSLTMVAGNTLLQRIAPNEVLSRVFGVLEGSQMIAMAIGSLLVSALVVSAGISAALVAAGAFVPVLIAVLWIPLRAIDRDAKAPDMEALALLRDLPIFAPLAAPAFERIMANLSRLEVAAGDVLIREGDVGDRFYVIVEGDVSIVIGGEDRGVRHAGSYVGEIALLRNVPRTATVTALTPLRLLALERDAFLAAVTGHPQARERAEAVVEERLRS